MMIPQALSLSPAQMLVEPGQGLLLRPFDSWCRSLPASAEEVYLRSAVLLHSLIKIEDLTRALLPNGCRNGELFQAGDVVVALEYGWCSRAMRWLRPGEWYTLTGAFGNDVAELHAYLHRYPYPKSLAVLASWLGLHEKSAVEHQCGKPDGWVQERSPLHPHFDRSLPFPELGILRQFYRNVHGMVIGFVQRIPLLGAGHVDLYGTLWRKRNSVHPRWAEIMPEPPYMLFNADLMALWRNSPVIFAGDEFVADSMSGLLGVVVSAVPGGLRNLPDADLSMIRGRPVRVVLRPEDLPYGLQIGEKLKTSGAVAPCFSLSQDEPGIPFDQFEGIAASEGVTLLPLPNGPKNSVSAVVISEAGEPIPGGEEERAVLLDPIIRAGYLVWLYAEPKIGKTLLAIAIAHAVSSAGRVAKWHAQNAHDVLYVDGEMLPNELGEWISMVQAGSGHHERLPTFATICAKCQEEFMIDLASAHWQGEIEKALKGTKLLILDNFQSLTDNGPGALAAILPWLRKLTQRGIAVLVLDHTNRDGELQGSIAKERIANLSLVLRYADDEAKAEKRILVEYPVARRLHGSDAEPFEMLRKVQGNALSFEVLGVPSVVELDIPERIAKIAKVVFAKDVEGLSYPQIADAYGIPRSTASDNYQAAKDLAGPDKAAFARELQRLKSGCELAYHASGGTSPFRPNALVSEDERDHIEG